MEKALSLILALMLCIGIALPALAADSDFTIEDGVLMTVDDVETKMDGVLTKYNGPGGDVTIPAGVKAIGNTAFRDCESLTSVTIPAGVTAIGRGSFNGSGNLTSVTIPVGVTSIGRAAFQYCNSLTSVTIPEGVTELREMMFDGCSSLTSVTLPASLKIIYAWVFRDCDSLKDVYYAGTEAQWNQIAISTGEYGNPSLLNATIHYNSAAPAKPVVMVSPQKVTLDGAAVEPEHYNIDGDNFFKLRDLASLLNGTAAQFEIGYDDATRTISVTTGKAYTPNGDEMLVGVDQSASAVVSAQSIVIDGTAQSLTAYNIGGNNFFRLRDLNELLGYGVDYDAATNTAIITSK